MSTMNFLLSTTSALLLTSCAAQMKNSSTVTIRVDGDCAISAERIEAAVHVKGEAEAKWDVDSKVATITYDSVRTDLDAIQRRIAQAGYDTPNYLAPDAAYAQLPSCCQYERSMKHGAVQENGHADMHGHGTDVAHDENADDDHSAHSEMPAPDGSNPMAPIWMHYFALKDALVASNAKLAMKSAEDLDGAMHSVDTEKLPKELQATWTEVMQAAMPTLHPLSKNGELDQQRALFAKLTAPMEKLALADPQVEPIYLDHCPMFNGGSDWLSTEKVIKNPFYGDMMLGCGSVQKTIQ